MNPIRAALLRLLLAAAVLIPAAWAGGDAVIRAAVPAMARVLAFIAPDFEVRHLALARVAGEQRVTVEVNLARTTIVGERALVPDPRGSASAFTPAGHGLLVPWVAALGVVGWPYGRLGELLARALLLLPLLAAWIVLDAPLMLAASIWQLLLDAVAPGTTSFLGAVPLFLVGGGRIVIGLAMAAGVVWAVSRLFARVVTPRAPSPA